MLISPIKNSILTEKNIQLDMLRLDLLHPEISGNKWFKLKYNMEQALAENKKTILSFGGAYSNHLHAMAFAGKLFSFKTIGIIRGEKVENETLRDCEKWGMEVHYISRSEYRQKNESEFLLHTKEQFPEAYIIPEGGNNALGIKGCKEILDGINLSDFDLICCAAGTAATFTGLIESSLPGNKLLGFCVGSSRVDLQACKLEYSIVSPK